MKKFLFVIILTAVSVAAQAQYATEPIAKRAGSTIKMDGQKLSKAECEHLLADIDGEDYSADWAKARGWRAAGISMISAGAGIAAVGAGTFLVGALTSMVGAAVGATTGAIVGSIGGQESAQETASTAAQNGADAGRPYMTAGLIMTAVGAAINIAGIPITAVNCTKMSKLVDKYNESHLPVEEPLPEPAPEVLLSFGATRNGIGLSLRF